jgi:hypothetical protein
MGLRRLPRREKQVETVRGNMDGEMKYISYFNELPTASWFLALGKGRIPSNP